MAHKQVLECSNCGARNNWERYKTMTGVSGIRCLACGHQKKDRPTAERWDRPPAGWTWIQQTRKF